MIAYLYPHPHATDGLDRVVVLQGNRLTVGRSTVNDVELAFPNISRHHAVINFDETNTRWILADAGSSNGTFVNGERLSSPCVLAEGDILSFGTVDCMFSCISPENHPTMPNFISLKGHESSLKLINDGTSFLTKDLNDCVSSMESEPMDLSLSLELAQCRLQIMYDLAGLTGKSTSIEQMTARALDLLFQALKVDRAVILMCDLPNAVPSILLVRFRNPENAGLRFPISNTIIERCLAEKVGILCMNQAPAGHESNFRSSAICVPLVAHLDVLGALFLDSFDGNYIFTEEDLAFAASFGTNLALAISNFRLNQRSIRSARMAAMGITVAGLAHNVKNILQLIDAGMSMMDNAVDKKPSNDETAIYWPVVRRGVGRMQELCRELLSFSRQAPPVLEEVNVNKIIRELHDSVFDTMCRNSIDLRLDLSDYLPPHLIDAEGLTRALSNLLTNAMEAMGQKGGQIVLKTEVNDDSSSIRIIVADTGVGIPVEKLLRIWEPFYTTKGKRGTGLGLAMTRKLIEDMNGHICVASTEGVGTTFILTFPCKNTSTENIIEDDETGYLKDSQETIITSNKKGGLYRRTKNKSTHKEPIEPYTDIILPPDMRTNE